MTFTLIVISSIIFFFLVFKYSSKSNGLPRNWPLVGMLPTMVLNFHRLPDKLTQLLEKSINGTITIYGLWFANMDIVVTSNLANVQHIMSTNFWSYPKGSDFHENFDVLGVGLFNSDLEEWNKYRKMFHAYSSHEKFRRFMAKVIPVVIKEELIPVLDHVSNKELIVDLADLFKRYAYDLSCKLSTGYSPRTLSVEFPYHTYFKTIDNAREAIFSRHLIPSSLWKLQRLLGIGKERNLTASTQFLRQNVTEYVSMKRKEPLVESKREDEFDLLGCLLTEHEIFGSMQQYSKDFIRDSVLGFMFATDDSATAALTWLFWLLSKNPIAEMKIREEIKTKFQTGEKYWVMSSIEEVNKLVYVHAALCETFRLFPPVPYLMRTPLQPDILPSGDHVNPKTKVVMCAYAMGRMKSIWGDDCLEFKLERWINEKAGGGIKHEPTNKFLTFSSGPRICLGKEMAFNMMKAVAATIIYNYQVQVQETGTHLNHKAGNFILSPKNGLMCRIKSRWD